jgi:hypothetical protein
MSGAARRESPAAEIAAAAPNSPQVSPLLESNETPINPYRSMAI